MSYQCWRFTKCQRPGGYSGMDLYVAFMKNGAWGQPLNLGPEINSINNDFAPCLSSGVLVFTSGRMLEPWSKAAKKDFKTLMAKFSGADNQTDNIWYALFSIDRFRNQ